MWIFKSEFNINLATLLNPIIPMRPAGLQRAQQTVNQKIDNNKMASNIDRWRQEVHWAVLELNFDFI